MRLEGRTALVTGASRGLGSEIAASLAREGAYVFCGYRSREQDASEVAEKIGGRAIRVDVRDAASVRACIDEVVAARSGIDVLVCSAGIARDQLLALATDDDLLEPIDVNLAGAIRCCRAAARAMMQRGGSMVLVSSIAGIRASPGQAGYSASKGGLHAFVRTAAVELAPKGVRINAVVPGLIDAGMVKRMDRRARDQRAEHIPMGRLGRSDEVARAAVFLASDDSSYITGQSLVVDGGLSL